MKKILLIGHGGFYNRGCEAIARGTVEIIKQHIPDSIITLCSYAADEDIAVSKGKNIRIDSIISGGTGAKKPSLAWMWQTFDRRILSFNMNFHDYLLLPFYRESDVVISIGGDNFSDDYGGPQHYFSSMVYSKKAGAKTVIWAATIGPFSDRSKVKEWAKILSAVDLITAREDMTVEYLRSLGVTRNVHRVADPAFLLPAVRPERYPAELDKAQMKIGIGMSSLIARYGVSQEQYTRAFADFIRHLWQSFGAGAILVPHVIGEGKFENDLAVCKEVLAQLPKECPATILSKNYDACEMKYCISRCDFFIGARTHSTIAGLSAEVPTITIAYSSKALGINKQLLGTDEFVIPISEVSCRRLSEVFDKLVKDKNSIKRQLHENMPAMRSLALKGGEYLAEILG
jgi:colanic acid/amylovoran biosynthesis protein